MFHLDLGAIQTFMFLKLTVAGHLTIFVTRTRGPFWSSSPAPILLLSKLLATAAAVWGIFMAPIGWHWALVVWAYCLAWFFVNDWVKLAAHRIFAVDHSGLLTKVGLYPKQDSSGGLLREPAH
jgi:H+-transporting ATPase